MNESMARGYATAYIQKQANHGLIQKWVESVPRKQIFDKFIHLSKNEPGEKVLEHMAPLFPACFGNPFMPHVWSETRKTIVTQIITKAPETRIVEVDRENTKTYLEKSVFINNIIYSRFKDNCDETLFTAANISHHAIRRLLERSHLDKDCLEVEIQRLLSILRDLAQVFTMTSLDKDKSHNFFISYKKGALVARTLKVVPKTGNSYQGDLWVFSIRTFLDENKLQINHRERMPGMEVVEGGKIILSGLGSTREMTRGMLSKEDLEHVRRWIKGSGRLHCLKIDD